MSYEAEGLGKPPGREGIGGETGMYQGYSAGEIGTLQVKEVLTELSGGEHTLVDESSRGEGYYIARLLILNLLRLKDSLLNPLAYHVKKVFETLAVIATDDKELSDKGLCDESVMS